MARNKPYTQREREGGGEACREAAHLVAGRGHGEAKEGRHRVSSWIFHEGTNRWYLFRAKERAVIVILGGGTPFNRHLVHLTPFERGGGGKRWNASSNLHAWYRRIRLLCEKISKRRFSNGFWFITIHLGKNDIFFSLQNFNNKNRNKYSDVKPVFQNRSSI